MQRCRSLSSLMTCAACRQQLGLPLISVLKDMLVLLCLCLSPPHGASLPQVGSLAQWLLQASGRRSRAKGCVVLCRGKNKFLLPLCSSRGQSCLYESWTFHRCRYKVQTPQDLQHKSSSSKIKSKSRRVHIKSSPNRTHLN